MNLHDYFILGTRWVWDSKALEHRLDEACRSQADVLASLPQLPGVWRASGNAKAFGRAGCQVSKWTGGYGMRTTVLPGRPRTEKEGWHVA